MFGEVKSSPWAYLGLSKAPYLGFKIRWDDPESELGIACTAFSYQKTFKPNVVLEKKVRPKVGRGELRMR